ncbi:MAG: LytTR family transcriptional regulator DNA-binding domain-containing protein [Dokdonia sp.]|jgi:DNA-binding LytR/AlgR family response regulator
MRYTYVIIDDNPASANAIHLALESHSDFQCVGVAASERSALDLILEFNPALVFWNMEIAASNSDLAAFSMINEINKLVEQTPAYVLIAKTRAYAIEGIRHQVLDYILEEDLGKYSVQRTIMSFRKRHKALNPSTLCLKSYGDYKFLDTDEVLFLKADNNTTDFICADGTKISAFKSLKYFQDTLPNHFVRVHNSYIVNSRYISRIHFGKSHCMMTHSDYAVPFSKSYRDQVEGIKNTLTTQSMVIG